MTNNRVWPVIALGLLASALWPAASRWWARRRERRLLDERIANALGDGAPPRSSREAFVDAMRALQL